MKKIHNYNKTELISAVKKSRSLSQVLAYFNIPVLGNNYRTLKNRLKKWDIDISHFTGQSWSKNMSLPPKVNINEYLSNTRKINTHNLKNRLIKEGIFLYQCQKCLLTEWNNQPIPIELHHIDGNNQNNNPSNLQILCPNCHAQTNNYCSKKTSTKKQYLCTCGNSINKKSTKCLQCYHSNISQNIPNKEELILELQKHKTMLSIAKFYNVSDNAIRKWCIKYNIDYKQLLNRSV